MKLQYCRFLLVLSLPVQSPAPVHVALDRASATVEFFAVGWPSALEIHGKGSGLHGEIALADSRASGRVSFDLRSLDTGIGLRNRHMKEEYLETERFPHATLTLTPMELGSVAAERSFGARRIPFRGVLELHGTARPVAGEATVRRDDRGVTVEAGFEVRTSDFGIRTLAVEEASRRSPRDGPVTTGHTLGPSLRWFPRSHLELQVRWRERVGQAVSPENLDGVSFWIHYYP